METLFWFSLFILSFFFFYLMKLYLFHLDVASPDGSYMWIIIFFLAGLFFFFSLGESLVGLF